MFMNVAVIGAGAAGLTAAWELVKAGQEITLIEADDRIGGLAAGFQLPEWDWSLEKFYHHWFTTDTDVLQLVDEIRCSRKVIICNPLSKVWIDGKFYPLSDSRHALKLPLSPIHKMRLALAGLYLKFPHRWQSLDHISAYEWLHQRVGKEVYQKLWAIVLESKFKDSYREIPLSWLWAHIYNRSARIAIYEGGFQTLWATLAEMLRRRGVKILLNSPIDNLRVKDDKLAISIQGEIRLFDRVISTLSPPAMLKIAPALVDTDYARQMIGLKNVGAVCLVLALKQSLFTDGTYSVNLPSDVLNEQGFPFINVYEHTNLANRVHYGGDRILYCVDYVATSQTILQATDTEIMTQFTHSLPRLNPTFSLNWIRRWWVFKSAAAQPIPSLNAGKYIPPIKTPLPGLYWITMSQMHPWGKGTNFAVRSAKAAAKMLLDDHLPLE
jgi:protoporphyrinogen oxidase